MIFALLLLQSLVPTFTNVSYGSKPTEKMDVYLAPGGASANPAVIEMHPGGWAGGSKSDFSKYGGTIEKLFQKGITVISIDYPLAPQDLYPAQNLSCQRAIQFVRSKAAAWNIDKNKIGAIGRSAGAHLAMWVATSPDAAVPGSHDVVLKESSRLRAVVAVEGPSDFTDPYYKYDPAVSPGTSPVWQYFGATTQAQWDAVPLASKQAASPRWLASGAAANINKNVAFLGIYAGDALASNSAQLAAPSSDVHALLQGMIFIEALHAIGCIDATIWAAAEVQSSSTGSFASSETATDWLWLKLQTASITNFGWGTPGCFGDQFLLANGPATIGNNNFTITGYLALLNTHAAVLVDVQPLPDLSDPLGIGLRLLVDPWSPTFGVYDTVINSFGNITLTIPIPADPQLSGSVYYAQGITTWQAPGAPIGCLPSPLHLSSTNGLRIVIQ